MIKSLVEQNKQELEKQGFCVLIQPISINVTGREQVFLLGDDRYILTGCIPSSNNILQDAESVMLVSPNAAIVFNQGKADLLGTSVLQTFVESIIVTTTNNFDKESKLMPYTLNFIKITPLRQ